MNRLHRWVLGLGAAASIALGSYAVSRYAATPVNSTPHEITLTETVTREHEVPGSFTLKAGDGVWQAARRSLGPDASNADIGAAVDTFLAEHGRDTRAAWAAQHPDATYPSGDYLRSDPRNPNLFSAGTYVTKAAPPKTVAETTTETYVGTALSSSHRPAGLLFEGLAGLGVGLIAGLRALTARDDEVPYVVVERIGSVRSAGPDPPKALPAPTTLERLAASDDRESSDADDLETAYAAQRRSAAYERELAERDAAAFSTRSYHASESLEDDLDTESEGLAGLVDGEASFVAPQSASIAWGLDYLDGHGYTEKVDPTRPGGYHGAVRSAIVRRAARLNRLAAALDSSYALKASDDFGSFLADAAEALGVAVRTVRGYVSELAGLGHEIAAAYKRAIHGEKLDEATEDDAEPGGEESEGTAEAAD